jgi:hypothetical protein
MSDTKPSLPKPKIVVMDGKAAAHLYFTGDIRYPLLPSVQAKVGAVVPLLDRLSFLYRSAPKKDHAEYMIQIFEYMFDEAAIHRRLDRPSFDEQGILAAARDTLSRCHRVLPGPFLHIFVLPRFSAKSAVNGHGAGGNAIFLYVNPDADWKKTMTLVLAHEYFHLASPQFMVRAGTVSEHLVDEGLAVLFSEEISGDKDRGFPPMTIKQAGVWLEKIRPRLLEAVDARNVREIIRGDGYGKKNLGYSLGRVICRQALRALRLGSWSKIADMPFADIFSAGEGLILRSRKTSKK